MHSLNPRNNLYLSIYVMLLFFLVACRNSQIEEDLSPTLESAETSPSPHDNQLEEILPVTPSATQSGNVDSESNGSEVIQTIPTSSLGGVDLCKSEAYPPLSGDMVYDSKRHVILLYGNIAGTWEYDGCTWQEINTPTIPEQSPFLSLTYDESRSVAVLFGFRTMSGKPFIWEYDSQDWHLKELNEPGPAGEQFLPAISYFPEVEGVFILGFCWDICKENFYTTWFYDGTQWYDTEATLFNPEGQPIKLLKPQLVYDSNREVMILQTTWGWTYEFKDGEWHTILTPEDENSLRVFDQIAFDSQRGVIVAYETPVGKSGVLPQTWEFTEAGWQIANVESSPGVRTLFSMAYDKERGVVVLFGGRDIDGNILIDTWEYDGTVWIQR
ncbi:MAG: hypothetical protein IT327_07400 [Anaerolineae bacterium]|nr:hypothetical protein [Anaerolineae bacterium]